MKQTLRLCTTLSFSIMSRTHYSTNPGRYAPVFKACAEANVSPVKFFQFYLSTKDSTVAERRNRLWNTGFAAIERLLETIFEACSKQPLMQDWISSKVAISSEAEIMLKAS